MSGGKSPKTKGNSYERELVNEMGATPGLTAERARGSDGRALGESEGVDLILESEFGFRWRIQAKRKKQLPGWLALPEGADAVVFREDRGESYIMIPLKTFLASL